MAITLDGLGDLLDRFEHMGNANNFKAEMGKACALVERSAKQKAPKGNGELRRSITSEVLIDGGTITADEIKGLVFTPLEYAPYVEYGTGLFAEEGGRKDVPWNYQDDEGEWHSTSGQHPQPFMRPALNENRTKIIRTIKGGFEQ